MAVYVIDASIAIQELITDTQTPHVRALFKGVTETDQLWFPEFGLVECVNVIWKQTRFAGLSSDLASQMIQRLPDLPLRIAPVVTSVLVRAFQVGLAHQLAIYDSVYIAMAERLGCQLITTDKRQMEIATSVGLTLKPITDFAPAP